MNILITGASGFIGQHLLADIDPNKHAISVVTRNTNKNIPSLPENSKVIVADLTAIDSLKKAFANIDVIINLAAEVRNEKKLTETNVKGTENLLEAAALAGVQKIIHLSSVGVVGMQYNFENTVVTEEAKCNPKNEYERTKYLSEQILVEGCRKNNIALSILRPTNVFGEKHPFHATLKIMKHIKEGKLIVLAKEAKVNYVYVKDLSAAILKLIDQPQNKILNIGYPSSYKEFIAITEHILNKKAKTITLPDVLFKTLNFLGIKKLRVISNKVIYDDSRLKSFFDYPCGLEKGLTNTYKYFHKKGLIE